MMLKSPRKQSLLSSGAQAGAMTLMGMIGLTWLAQAASAADGSLSMTPQEYLDFENHAVVTLQEVPDFLAPDAGRRSLEGLIEQGLTERRKRGARVKKAIPLRKEIRPSSEAASNSSSGRDRSNALTLEEEETSGSSDRSRGSESTSSDRRSRLGTTPVGRGGSAERADPRSVDRRDEDKEKELTPLERTAEELGTAEKIVDSVINIGKKIWAVVEAGEPVYTASYNRANALPDSMKHWSEMSDWNPTPKSKIFRFSVTNLYGITTVDFAYRISYVYGGKFDGSGAYLNDVGVETYSLSVLPMYSFDASAEVSSTSNIGSQKNPVAGMRLRVKMVVKTIVKHGEFSHEFFIRGNDGSLTNLTEGN